MALTAHTLIISNSLFLKTTSFIIGCILWAVVSNMQTVSVNHTVSIAFYNVPDTWRIESHDSITVKLMAKRAHLRTLSTEKLTAHIDAATLKEGENHIDVLDTSLFVPMHINLVEYPRPLIVHVHSPAF